MVLEDKAFEGSGAFLLGAVLDRFFAEYVAINHFTQTVVRTPERGEIMRWPPRIGLQRRLMTFRAELVAEPWRFDLLAVLRRLERENPGKPRIGDARKLADEFVTIGQNPYFEFPDSNVEAASIEPTGLIRLKARFLGMFGPQGALPLTTTEEAYGWLRERDDAFARFVDVFQRRFLALFFRAWADAHPVAQNDRPDRRSISDLYRLDDRDRDACVPRRRFNLGFRQAAVCRVARCAGQDRLTLALVLIESAEVPCRNRRVRRRLAHVGSERAHAFGRGE